MQRALYGLALVVAIAMLGCSSSDYSQTRAPLPAHSVGPHGGAAYLLEGEKGYVEIVNEPEVATSTAPTAVVAYFLSTDSKTPLGQAPSGVHLSVGGGKAMKDVSLTSAPKADDPAGGVRFVTTPGPYALSELRGQFYCTVDSQPTVIELIAQR